MAKIGIIWVGYQCADLMAESLGPWIEARAARLGGNEFVICAVSVPFEGFDHGSDTIDGTLPMLHAYCGQKNIDHYITSSTPMKETEARGQALRWLVEQGVELTIQVDADEFYTEMDISRVFAFIAANPYIACFRLSLRNLVFTKDQWLAEPFTPMRIHRIKVTNREAVGFWDDNNVIYEPRGASSATGAVRDIQLSTMTMPAVLAWIEHHTWLSDFRSKRKIEYQLKGRGWPECSFRWDEATNQLRFNEDYYRKRGLPLPEVLHA